MLSLIASLGSSLITLGIMPGLGLNTKSAMNLLTLMMSPLANTSILMTLWSQSELDTLLESMVLILMITRLTSSSNLACTITILQLLLPLMIQLLLLLSLEELEILPPMINFIGIDMKLGMKAITMLLISRSTLMPTLLDTLSSLWLFQKPLLLLPEVPPLLSLLREMVKALTHQSLSTGTDMSHGTKPTTTLLTLLSTMPTLLLPILLPLWTSQAAKVVLINLQPPSLLAEIKLEALKLPLTKLLKVNPSDSS